MDTDTDTDTDPVGDTDTDPAGDTGLVADTALPVAAPFPTADLVSYTAPYNSIPSELYVMGSTGTGFTSHTSWQPSGGGPLTHAVHLGDVDGDGTQDLIFYKDPPSYTPNELRVMLNTGTGFGAPASWAPSTPVPNADQTFVGDLNLDGLADLIFYTANVGFTAGDIQVMLSTGTGFASATSWKPVWAMPNADLVVAADADGDGQTDLVFYEAQAGTVPSRLWTMLSTGTGFAAASSWLPGSGVPTVSTLLAGDLTGDGRDDLVFYSPPASVNPALLQVMPSTGTGYSSLQSFTGTGAPAAQEVLLGDVHGDGLDDLVFFTPGTPGLLEVMASTGTGFTSPTSWAPASPSPATTYVLLGDVDGQ